MKAQSNKALAAAATRKREVARCRAQSQGLTAAAHPGRTLLVEPGCSDMPAYLAVRLVDADGVGLWVGEAVRSSTTGKVSLWTGWRDEQMVEEMRAIREILIANNLMDPPTPDTDDTNEQTN